MDEDGNKEEKRVKIILCEECKKQTYKYKCPGCMVKTCSLVCVKLHKNRTGCNGKRCKTEFLPISKFTDNTILSDYFMLEEVKRVAESAQRMRAKLGAHSNHWLPPNLKSLRNAAGSRSTKLTFLPSGMSKRVTNRSYYNYRKKFISWTIEWRFHSTDVALFDHGINENRSLSSVIENHLKPGPWTHPLKQFCDEPLDSLRFFIRKYSKGPKSPFRELDVKSPIRTQLAKLFILEYPVIHVFLPSHNFDFEIVKEMVEQKPAVEESTADDPPSPMGIIFREEEIEETNSSAPQVYDVRRHSNPDHALETIALRKPDWSLSKDNSAHGSNRALRNIENAQDDGIMQPSSLDIDDIELADGADFDFEQGFLDAYSDLFAHHNPDDFNPDDFLDLEGVLSGETGNCTDSKAVEEEEELEEGEIPEF